MTKDEGVKFWESKKGKESEEEEEIEREKKREK